MFHPFTFLSQQGPHFLPPEPDQHLFLPCPSHFYSAPKRQISKYYCLIAFYAYIQQRTMEEIYNNKTQDEIAFEIEEFKYSRKMGSFKPKFAGIPEDYVPLTWTEGLLYALIVLLTIGSVLGIMIGFMFWITRHGLADFAAIWSAIFLAFVMIMILAFYFGGKNRIREEKILIALAQKRQEEMKGKSNVEKERKYA